MFPEGRLFDFLIVGAVALIVVGPKDLPLLMRKIGQFMARVRGMAAEFRASFDELARQSELDELRREVQALRSARPMDFAATHLGASDVISEIKSDLADTKADIAAATAPLQAPPSTELAAGGGTPPPEIVTEGGEPPAGAAATSETPEAPPAKKPAKRPRKAAAS
jgi:sec-independent protein translocase protein TatB